MTKLSQGSSDASEAPQTILTGQAKDIEYVKRLTQAAEKALAIVSQLQGLETWGDKAEAIDKLRELRAEFDQECKGHIDDPSIKSADDALKGTAYILNPPPARNVSNEQARLLMDIDSEKRDSITIAIELLEERVSGLHGNTT